MESELVLDEAFVTPENQINQNIDNPDVPDTPQEEAEEEEQELLLQLIYISAASVPFSQKELKALLKKARENNHELDVSGILIFHDGAFFQVLEGPPESVYAIYDRISQDTRHDEVKLLLKSEVEDRSFPDWSMGFVNIEKASDLRSIPGFTDFFKPGFSLPEMRKENSRLGRVLREFRDEDRWHQRIE